MPRDCRPSDPGVPRRAAGTAGRGRLDLLYAPHRRSKANLQETVEGFAELVAEDTVGLLGVSNHDVAVERARTWPGRPACPATKCSSTGHSYYGRARPDQRHLPDGNQGAVAGDLLSYVRDEPALALVAYSPLLGGAYVRADKPLARDFDPRHPHRLAACGKWRQRPSDPQPVVLSWLIGGEVPVIPWSAHPRWRNWTRASTRWTLSCGRAARQARCGSVTTIEPLGNSQQPVGVAGVAGDLGAEPVRWRELAAAGSLSNSTSTTRRPSWRPV